MDLSGFPFEEKDFIPSLFVCVARSGILRASFHWHGWKDKCQCLLQNGGLVIDRKVSGVFAFADQALEYAHLIWQSGRPPSDGSLNMQHAALFNFGSDVFNSLKPVF